MLLAGKMGWWAGKVPCADMSTGVGGLGEGRRGSWIRKTCLG